MKETEKILLGLGLLILLQYSGDFLAGALSLPLPGNLTGLLLLLALLGSGMLKLDTVAPAADLLLDNLMLFFVPLAVGLMTIIDLVRRDALAIIASMLISTVAVMIITAKAVDLTIAWQQRRRGTRAGTPD